MEKNLMSRAHMSLKRRGAVAPLTAILVGVFVAMTAFAVDMGYIVYVQAQLQNTADAAALAGASQLVQIQVGGSNVSSAATTAVNNAIAEAKEFAFYNLAGGKNISLANSDIVVGTQASVGGAVTPWTAGSPFPNAVQVTVRRDMDNNGSLSLFFAPFLGVSKWDGQATATARLNPAMYSVTGFNSPNGGKNGRLLPIAVDAAFWNTFVATGKSPDGKVYDNFTFNSGASANKVSSGVDGIPELKDFYPNNTSPGNFGLVNLNYTNPQNNTPAFSDWILNGPSPSDLQSFGTNGFQASAGSPISVKGGPGLKSTLVSDLAAIAGQQRVVPLFSSYKGNGSNTYYTITGFAGVTIVSATGNGSNISVVLQPTIVIDPTATYTTNGSTSSAQFVYPALPVQLTR